MFVDSHCHLDFPELSQRLTEVLANMQLQDVSHALCVSVDLPRFPAILALVEKQANLFASVGVHPDYENVEEPDVQTLVQLAQHPKVLAIGETGLDYYRLEGRSLAQMEWQRERFRVHIRAAKQSQKPLIVHTRASVEDTLSILQEEGADEVGGVMHCFTESYEAAMRAIDLNFYISISGIVTFKNAAIVQDVAKRIPLERLLIETDSPYLAPVPKRGQLNEPAYVYYVAAYIAELRAMPIAQLAQITSQNFSRLFKVSLN